MTTIVLAHVPSFPIGPLTVRPATRTLLRDGVETVVEPRIMQVLIALAQTNGAVVTRDELVDRCWEGRIVGDDAINRVLSRLRHLQDDVARDAFRIETITRVGYRMIPTGTTSHDTLVDAEQLPMQKPQFGRRRVLIAGGVGAALIGSGGLWFELRPHGLPEAARAAIERGDAAIRDTTPDQNAAAVAAYRQATALAPDAAAPWGRLALAYRQLLVVSGAKDASQAAQFESRARGAIARALAIEPDNADALIAQATLVPFYRHWLQVERACLPLLQRFPEHGQLRLMYGIVLNQVGRQRESVDQYRKALALLPLWPQVHVRLVVALWNTGQLDQADAEMERAFAIWPRHYSAWFTRQRMLAYTGRGPAALAMLADIDTRPIAIPDWNFAMTEAETRALMTRSPADIEKASRLLFDAAHRAVGFAANAIIFHAVVGRIDDAFTLLGAFFFDRGFSTGPRRYSDEQGMYDSHRERETGLLYMNSTAPLRADPRFLGILREVGFEDYWRQSGTKPDYRV